MSKRSTDRKQVIAKRKKQFLALIFSVAFALIPTVSVMAESITITDDNDLESYIGKNIYPGEELTWIYSSGATFYSGGFYAIFRRNSSDTDGKRRYSTGEKNRDSHQDRVFSENVTDYTVPDLDHWQVYSCKIDLTETAFTKIQMELKAVYTTDAATVKVSADPAGGGNPKSGKERVFNGDKNISLEAGKNEGYVFEKWSVDSNHITIADPSSENTTFEAGDVAAGETINIKAEYTKIYEVTFDPNGGEGDSVTIKTGKSGKLTGQPEDPTWKDHEFTGWYNAKEGGDKIDTSGKFLSDQTLYAHWKDSAPVTPTPKPTPGPHPWSRHSSDDGDMIDNTPAAKVNPDAIGAYYYINGVLQTNAIIGKQEQSALATSVFKAAVPVGWNWAFPMSMSYNGKNEYSLKNGAIKLYVPAAYQKSGRQFAFLAMDKNGKVILLPDQDVLANTVTVTPNIEGYAYVLIYKD